MIKQLLLGAVCVVALAPAVTWAQPATEADTPMTSPPDPWLGAPAGLFEREDWLKARIQASVTDGNLDTDEASSLMKDLGRVKRLHGAERAGGTLSEAQKADIAAQLDVVHDKVMRAIGHGAVRSY